jgi:hypothetical protein
MITIKKKQKDLSVSVMLSRLQVMIIATIKSIVTDIAPDEYRSESTRMLKIKGFPI